MGVEIPEDIETVPSDEEVAKEAEKFTNSVQENIEKSGLVVPVSALVEYLQTFLKPKEEATEEKTEEEQRED